MAMLSAMFSGVSGLSSHGRALSSVADNIANINTTAFKATRANFGDIMVQSLTVGGSLSNQVGTGSRIIDVQNIMTQGSFESTDIPTDLAINGSGFFLVSNPANESSTGTSDSYLTRAGNFLMDSEGYLVNTQGYRLRGFNVNSDGELKQVVEDLRLLTQQVDAVPTTKVEMSINLDAEDTDKHDPSQAINPSDETTWNYMNTVQVYDSLGISHDLELLYQRLTDYEGNKPTGTVSTWKVSSFEDSDGTVSANPPYPDNTYYLHFDTNGHLLGISTGQPAYGDIYTSSGTVSTATSAVSNRPGETFGYTTTAGGAQTYYSSYDISGFASWDAGDTLVIGGDTYDQATYNSITDVAAAINANTDNTGVYAATSGNTLSIYSNQGAATVTINDQGTTGLTGNTQSLNDVITAINSGDNSSTAFSITGGAAAAATTITIGTTAVTLAAGDTAADLATKIDAAGLGLDATAIGDSVFVTSTAVGNAYNYTVSVTGTAVTTAGNMVGGMDGSGTTMVEASAVTSGSGVALRLARTDTGAAATVTITSNNTLGDNLGLDFDTFTHNQYASDAQGDSSLDTTGSHTLTFDFPDATADQEIVFDYTPSDSSASTQSAGSNETFYLSQDGSPRGTLQDLQIDDTGLITGQFSNGILKTLGAVALTNVANPNGLKREGENLWSWTPESGDPLPPARPGNSGLGALESGALEQSNVDLADQFVKMINYQRGYQANARTISTTDDMLSELINLKR